MIFQKIWTAFQAALNGIANALIDRDPVAVYELEVDRATEQIKVHRSGVEQYNGFVLGVERQVAANKANRIRLEAQIKAHLKVGTEAARESARQLAIQLKETTDELAANEQQLAMHKEALSNHLLKLQEANKNIARLRQKAVKYKAEVKMARAEAEMARVAEALGAGLTGNLTTDLGQIEERIQRQIDHNRGKAQVAAAMSGQGVEQIKASQAAERVMAEDLLVQFELEAGLRTAETTPGQPMVSKTLGPATEKS